MIDLKPFYQSYTRAAHLRWLKGDLDGAIEMMQARDQGGQPAGSGVRRLGVSRLAFYELQRGRLAEAERMTDASLRHVPDYAAALLVRGRIQLASAGRSKRSPLSSALRDGIHFPNTSGRTPTRSDASTGSTTRAKSSSSSPPPGPTIRGPSRSISPPAMRTAPRQSRWRDRSSRSAPTSSRSTRWPGRSPLPARFARRHL